MAIHYYKNRDCIDPNIHHTHARVVLMVVMEDVMSADNNFFHGIAIGCDGSEFQM